MTVRIAFTSGETDVTWQTTYVCLVDDNCNSLDQIGKTALPIEEALPTDSGTQEMKIALSYDGYEPDYTDFIVVSIILKNLTVFSQDVSFKSNLNITTRLCSP